jgi:hypothetical protein
MGQAAHAVVLAVARIGGHQLFVFGVEQKHQPQRHPISEQADRVFDVL